MGGPGRGLGDGLGTGPLHGTGGQELKILHGAGQFLGVAGVIGRLAVGGDGQQAGGGQGGGGEFFGKRPEDGRAGSLPAGDGAKAGRTRPPAACVVRVPAEQPAVQHTERLIQLLPNCLHDHTLPAATDNEETPQPLCGKRGNCDGCAS